MPNEPADAVTLEDLYDAYGASCYRLAHRMVADEQLACTIVRDIFVDVWSGRSVFDPAQGSVQMWLLRVTHARTLAVVRSQRELRSDLVTEPVGVPPKLDTMLRYVLELAYYGGYTDAEIATRTGTTLSMVKSLKLQALRGMCARPSTPAPRQPSLHLAEARVAAQ